MKKRMLSIMVIGLVATSAHAATLSMGWSAQPGVDKLTLGPSDSAVVDVFLELGANGGDNWAGVFFEFDPIPATLVTDSLVTSVPGWATSGTTGEILGQFAQVNVGALDPFAGALTGTGTVLIAQFTIHLEEDGLPLGTQYELTIDNDTGPGPGLVTSTASFAALNPAFAAYSGYWTFGKGSPGVNTMAVQIPRDPLIITKIPEPASLAILGLGGLALLRRRCVAAATRV